MKWFFLPLMKERVCGRRSSKSCCCCCHHKTFFRSRHSLWEKQPWNPVMSWPPDWDLSQAGNTDIFIPAITSLWCDADSAAYSGRAAQQFGEFKLKYFSVWPLFLVTKYLPDFLALSEHSEASEPSWVVQSRSGNCVTLKSAKPS